MSPSDSPLVSIAVITRNMGVSLQSCLENILQQSFQDFELILVDDRSVDGTRGIVEKFRDARIRYFRNDQKLGYAATRNISLRYVRGEYVFFTDADCLPERHWLQSGLDVYSKENCIGVIGKTLPHGVSVRRSERRVTNLDGRFMTCNLSFSRETLQKLGGFDPVFDTGQEDVELGLRARRLGKIIVSEKMLVYHQIEKYTVGRLFKDAGRYKTQVMIFKRFPKDAYHLEHSPRIARGIFLKPEDWVIIFFPFLLLKSPSNQSLRDFLIIPFVYMATIFRRAVIWRTAIREKILLI